MDKRIKSIYVISIFITSFFIGQNIQSFLSPEDHSSQPTDPELPSTDPELPPTDPELPPTDPELPPADPELPPTDPELPPTDPELPPTDPELPPTDPELPPTEPKDEPTNPSLDTTAPIVKIERPWSSTFYDNDIPMRINATDASGIDRIWYNWNGINITYVPPTYGCGIIINFHEGLNTLQAWAIDKAGNVGSDSVTFRVDLSDRCIPLLIIDSPSAGNKANCRQLVKIWAYDSHGINRIWYNWNGRNISYTSEIYINFNYGWNTLKAWANDSGGNTQSCSVSFFIYNNYSSGPLPDYVPVAIGDVYWYNVSQSRSLAFGSEKTISKWSFEVLGIGGEMSSGIDLIVNYSKYIDNNLTETQMKVLFIPKSKGWGEFYDASPYIFTTNQFFDMAEGSSERYFSAARTGWHRNGTSFSESLCWGTHPLCSTFITYNAGILMHFEYKITDYFSFKYFTMDLIETPDIS